MFVLSPLSTVDMMLYLPAFSMIGLEPVIVSQINSPSPMLLLFGHFPSVTEMKPGKADTQGVVRWFQGEDCARSLLPVTKSMNVWEGRGGRCRWRVGAQEKQAASLGMKDIDCCI